MKSLKSQCWKAFDGSSRLFESCWNEYLKISCGRISDDVDAVLADLKLIASEKVNNPRSSFFFYGR